MPEHPQPKARSHPWEDARRRAAAPSSRDSPPDSPSGSPPDSPPGTSSAGRPRRRPAAYAELQATTNFTFLTGASHPDELVRQAGACGLRALGVTDRHSLAGIVRAHVAAREAGVPLMVGSRVTVGFEPPGAPERADAATGRADLLLHATSRHGYAALCRLLTVGKRRAPKGQCRLCLHDLLEHHQDLLVTVVPPDLLDETLVELLEGLRRVLNHGARRPLGPGRGADRVSIAVCRRFDGRDRARIHQLRLLAHHTGVPLVAVNDVLHHAPERQRLQDVLTCIRHGCTVRDAGLRLEANAERHLKDPARMVALLPGIREAIDRTVELADRATSFSLDELRYEYPDEVVPAGSTPMEHLRSLTGAGAAERYPHGVPERVRRQIEHEFALVDELGYAPYFLTVHDLCVFARSRRIMHQGRGAAANSAICYCLGVTAVDPDRIDVLFERFVSRERNEPPDIDIDFEHERREEVIQYIYRKYGRDRAALTAEVISYRGRSAVREVGKALGLSLDCVDRLARNIDWWSDGTVNGDRLRELGLSPDDPTIRHLVARTTELLGFPRHLSQHVGGFVITRGLLSEMVPVENAAMPDRTVIEWDKDDIDAMGMLKVDVLGLGMMTALRKGMAMVNEWAMRDGVDEREQAGAEEERGGLGGGSGGGGVDGGVDGSGPRAAEDTGGEARDEARSSAASSAPLQLHTIPSEDPAVYDMICRADTVGVFQIESRAQMSMLPRLRPRCFYDLVIEVAIVRPGPIQGDMVHPYLRRRDGIEPVSFPDDAVRKVLGKTLGVPLFQEQAMALAVVAAGFTPGEADHLRRAIAAWKTRGNQIAVFGEKIVEGMVARGYGRDFALRCFEQIKGFSGYGFPESHAASFALLVYASAWLKRYHPAAFAGALINSQPMGFYAPAQLVRDAQEHGVEVRRVDVNRSAWECTLEAIDAWPPVPDVGTGADATRPGRSRPGAGVEEEAESAAAPCRAPCSAQGRASSTEPDSPGRHDPCLRLGLRLVKGLSEEDGTCVAEAVRRHGPFRNIAALHAASGVRAAVLRRLAAADAFRSMGLERQHAVWQARSLRDEALPLFDAAREASRARTSRTERSAGTAWRAPAPDRRVVHDRAPADPDDRLESIALPPVPPLRAVARDYGTTGLSLREHPLSFIRRRLRRRRVIENVRLRDESAMPHGARASVAGLVLVRQRPSTAKGIVFMTLEDETATANLIVRPKVFQRFRRIARHGVAILAHGTVERQGAVVHVMVRRFEDLGPQLAEVGSRSRDFH